MRHLGQRIRARGHAGWAASLVAALALTGCGLVYTAPGVSENDGTDGELDVKVVAMTFQSVADANLDPYVPARLPAAFQPGAARRAIAEAPIPRLSGAPSPVTQTRPRPDFVPANLPPIGTPVPYQIGIGDVLLVSADPAGSGLEALPGLISAQAKRQGFTVQDDGAIAVPDVGRIRVAGMTLAQAEARIFDTLVEKRLDPTFSLEIAEFNSQRVSVGGLVGTPRLVPITLRPLTLEEAVQLAGGIQVPDPDTGLVRLFRGGEVFQIPITRFINDPRSKAVILTDGDSIYVGSAYEEDRARNFFQEQLASRSFELSAQTAIIQASGTARQNALRELEYERQVWLERVELGAVERDYAYLTGEVRRPVRFALPFEEKATLADVLFSPDSQGIQIQTADYGEIYVIRSSPRPEELSGVTAFHLDASNAANLALAARFELRPNDVVFISEQIITSWNRVISQIAPQIFTSAASRCREPLTGTSDRAQVLRKVTAPSRMRAALSRPVRYAPVSTLITP